MTSVDDFVRTNILTFPSIYPNRTAVLHHALCVIGNGYMWNENGEVVSDFFRPVPLWDKELALAEMEAQFKDEAVREMFSTAIRNSIESIAKVVEEVDTRMYEMVAIENIYPQSNEYALLMNIPTNVTPEWKEACDEMKVLAEEAGWKF